MGAKFGRGALLAKINIESAYRLVPVHLSNRHLQAVGWNNVNPMLPFGLCSALKFSMRWLIPSSGMYAKHIFQGPSTYSTMLTISLWWAPQRRSIVLDSECRRLSILIAEHKREGPTTYLVFLGIEVYTATFQLRLLDEKPHHLRMMRSRLAEWGRL